MTLATITVDITKWRSEREDGVISLLLSYAVSGDHDAVREMLGNRTCRSLLERGVIKAEGIES